MEDITFTNEIKEKYDNIDFSSLERYNVNYRERSCKRIIDKRDKPGKAFGHNAIVFMLNVLCRSKQLYCSLIENVNSENTISSYLIVRAHFETTGTLAYFYRYLQRYYCREVALDEINNILYRLSLSSKYLPKSGEIAAPEPVNVLNQIDTVDKVLEDIYKMNNKKLSFLPFRHGYDYLSEFCHPNFFGISTDSKIVDLRDGGKSVVYSDKPTFENSELGKIISGMELSCFVLFAIYDISFQAIGKNESLPILEK